MVILVVFSYPLQAHPCRASLDKVLGKEKAERSVFKYFAMTTTILILSYIVAITVTKLDVVRYQRGEGGGDLCSLINLLKKKILSFVGSTGSTTISFILPGLFYYKIHEQDPWRPGKIMAVVLSVYGLLIMAFCLTFNIMRITSH